MRHLAESLSYLISMVLLAGCVNFMSAKGEGMATIHAGDLDKIRTGMTEKEVVTLFGPPQSFGIDDQGRYFIHFENWKFFRTEGSFVVPFVGAISTDGSIAGITLQVYLKDGIVTGTSKYVYQKSSQQ